MRQFSQFGQKFGGESGILRLMDDLGRGLRIPGAMMLGGGNPSHIPEVQAVLRDRMAHILDSESDFEGLIGNYAGPVGHKPLIDALAEMFRSEYGWPIGPENIVLTNGSQTAFFFLFNLLAGKFADGTHKKVLLPLAPEYIGYADVGVDEGLFVSYRPKISLLPDNLFKYGIDFDAVTVDESIGAICVSRPTNPTGNVLTSAEIGRLSDLALQHDIPLIIDNAYGLPFPSIIFNEAHPVWAPHTILCMSLSKFGMPAARTGIVIADPQIVQAISAMNAVVSLAPGSFGASLAVDLVRSGEILRLSREVIMPHYARCAQQALGWLHEELAGLAYRIHKPEGAIFLWLWFPDLPITTHDLYERLMARQVIVVPGHYFFPGLPGEWRHRQECIRMNYSADPETLRAGIRIIAEEVRRAWQENG
jgi:valine--pyruvate aminotransferase